jgi:hypothetical protein
MESARSAGCARKSPFRWFCRLDLENKVPDPLDVLQEPARLIKK